MAAVQARVAGIQSQLQALYPVTPVSTTAVAGASSSSAAGGTASGSDFDAALSALLGATTGASSPATGGDSGADVVADARKYLGIAYRWGGTDPASGLDCSGLVQRVFADLGVKMPRVAAAQAKTGTEISSMAEARPGDLLVFRGGGHIGIYVGNGQMLHAPKTGDVVKISKVWGTPDTIRRVLPAGGDSAAPAAAASSLLRPSALRAGSSSGGASAGASAYQSLFDAAEAKYALPSGLLSAVAKQESGYRAGVVSKAGAVGLMQIMPSTAKGLGVDPRDPAQAVDGAARLLSSHLRAFGSVPLALAAYNAGPGAVRRYSGVPPYAETRKYVAAITATLSRGAS